MQPVAAWLVARPERAILVLIATFLVPITQILGSAVLVLLVLSHGPLRAIRVAGLGFVAILLIGLLSQVPLAQIFQVVLTIWLPGIGLALLLQRLRSLTLLLQTTVLLALVVIVGVYIVLGDPAAHWREVLENVSTLWREKGLEREADLFLQTLPVAPQLTGILVAIGWLGYVVALLVGYAARLSLNGRTAEYGRFSDLNFGRVLAIALALASVMAVVSAALWLQNLALMLFVIFWLQGLALLHWLHRRGRLPGLALVGIYVLSVPLGQLFVPAVGVLGYTDAWFNFRPRIAGK